MGRYNTKIFLHDTTQSCSSEVRSTYPSSAHTYDMIYVSYFGHTDEYDQLATAHVQRVAGGGWDPDGIKDAWELNMMSHHEQCTAV